MVLPGPGSDEGIGTSELPIRLAPVPSIVARARALHGENFLRREVADALDVSATTLRRLAGKIVLLAPDSTISYGTLTVPVYDLATVARLHAHLAEHRPPRGRPRLWSDAERSARRAAHSAAGYRHRRAALLHARGDHVAAWGMQDAAACITAMLRAAQTERSAARSLARSATSTTDVTATHLRSDMARDLRSVTRSTRTLRELGTHELRHDRALTIQVYNTEARRAPTCIPG